jgi:hypothetical protein
MNLDINVPPILDSGCFFNEPANALSVDVAKNSKHVNGMVALQHHAGCFPNEFESRGHLVGSSKGQKSWEF